MRDIVILGVILVGSVANLSLAERSRRLYHDLRAVRAVLNAVAVLCGAVALSVATWALQDNRTPEEVLLVVRYLVAFGQGILLSFVAALLYSVYRERGRV